VEINEKGKFACASDKFFYVEKTKPAALYFQAGRKETTKIIKVEIKEL